MNYWKTLATMGLYMEVSQVMGVPRNHHIIHVLLGCSIKKKHPAIGLLIIHVFVGIFRCSMVFFQENSYFGVPQTMETGHGFIDARYKALLTRKISEIKRFLGSSWLRRRWGFCSKTQSLRLRSWENIYYMCVYIYTHVYNRNCILYNLYN